MSPGSLTTSNSFPNFIAILALLIQKEKPKQSSRTSMCDSQRITKYLVEFNGLAARVQWGNTALQHQFYNGLPPRIKHEISRFGKSNNLQDLQTLSQTIDTRYWECQSEATRETPVNRNLANQEKLNNKSKTTSNPQAQTIANKKGNSG